MNFYTHLELYNKIVINWKQRIFFLIFQNEMRFLLLHYTSENEKKGHERCKKKKPYNLSIKK
jgi:hypothetical protein